MIHLSRIERHRTFNLITMSVINYEQSSVNQFIFMTFRLKQHELFRCQAIFKGNLTAPSTRFDSKAKNNKKCTARECPRLQCPGKPVHCLCPNRPRKLFGIGHSRVVRILAGPVRARRGSGQR